jgi:hypothetical protein
MICTTSNPAVRRYFYRLFTTMAFYVAFLVTAVWAFSRYHLTGALAYLLAVLPALPIVGMVVVVGMYLAEEKDEFQRTVLVQSLLWGIGATLSVTTVWGFLENFVQVPHLDLYLVFPLFWFFVGISTGPLKAKYK